MAVNMADQDIKRLLDEFADSVPAIEAQARVRYTSSESYQGRLVSKYRELHHYYNPDDQDQWPEDLVTRPDKIHVTANICRIAVDVDARLESLMPRFTIPTATLGPKDRQRAEGAEQLVLEWLDLSGIDTWLFGTAQIKSIYGKTVLKPYWDSDLKRPDVSLIENPANLRLGWGASDYSKLDWAVYEYGLSPQETKLRWPHVIIEESSTDGPPRVRTESGTHSDPLDQTRDDYWTPMYRQYSDYERTQVKIWDYWYKDSKGTVQNCLMVNGVIVEGPHAHAELADIPYIVIEHDHEPGSPEGIGTIEPLIDLQQEFNRLLSHGLQHIADDVDPAWYLSGDSADSVEVGMVPKAGEVTGVGNNTPGAWPKPINNFPISDMLGELWKEFHRLSGLPEILFGQTPGADTSGRAVAIQVEAAANRLDPRRRRLYQGLKELLIFWVTMAEKMNPKIVVQEADEETGQEEKRVGVGELVKGFHRWKLLPPEITPRDNFEVAQNEINKVNAKLTSMRSAMNATGTESPEAEIKTIEDEQSNLKINPASVQTQAAVYSILQQMQAQAMQNQQMAAQMQQMLGGAQGSKPPQSVLAQGQGAANEMMAQGQQAQPQPTNMEDQNQGPPQPMTQAGTPPPGGAGQMTSLSRQNGQALNQIKFDQNFGGGQ